MKPLIISRWDKATQSWIRELGIRAEGADADAQNAVSILAKPVTVDTFEGKDGYIMAYDETAGEFYLKADEPKGGELIPLIETYTYFGAVTFGSTSIVL